ncbi:MAG TPA: hypothetical protein VGG20_23725 [Thermoanaerobaculia bacterium]|jgi:methionyl-tRNA synthetase
MKPQIQIEEFRKLDLRVGTLTAARPHPSIQGLSILTVHLDEPVEVLSPASIASGHAPGERVVVATGLHPLLAGGLRFTRYLIPLAGQVTAQIPDGSRLS